MFAFEVNEIWERSDEGSGRSGGGEMDRGYVESIDERLQGRVLRAGTMEEGELGQVSDVD